MRFYKKEMEPEKEVEKFVKMTCDICLRDIQERGGLGEACFVKVQKTRDFYDDNEVTYRDICEECFDEKLIPWVDNHRKAG